MRKDSIENWYDGQKEKMVGVNVERVEKLTPETGWAVDTESGRTYRPDGAFFSVDFFRYQNSGQEVRSYVAPKIVEVGQGTVLAIARKRKKYATEYLLQAKPEAGVLHVSATVQASLSNLLNNKVLFSQVLNHPDFETESVEIMQDLGRMHGKINRHFLSRMKGERTDAMDLIGDAGKADAFRWSTQREVKKLLRDPKRLHAVSPHLLEWLGAFGG